MANCKDNNYCSTKWGDCKYDYKTTTINTTATTDRDDDYPIYAYEAREINFSVAKDQGCGIINKEINKAARRGETFICVNIKGKSEYKNKLAIKKHFEDREFKVLMSDEWLVISWEEEKNENKNTLTYPTYPQPNTIPVSPWYGDNTITCTYSNEADMDDFYP